jgi:hypothetical protein
MLISKQVLEQQGFRVEYTSEGMEITPEKRNSELSEYLYNYYTDRGFTERELTLLIENIIEDSNKLLVTKAFR